MAPHTTHIDRHATHIDQLVAQAKSLAASLRLKAERIKERSVTHVITLEPHQAQDVIAQRIDTIVEPQPVADTTQPYWIGDAELLYGTATLAKAKPISLPQFKRMAKAHGISDEQRKALWPKSRRLYSHKVLSVKALDAPRAYCRSQASRPALEQFAPQIAAVKASGALSTKELEKVAQDAKAKRLVAQAAPLAEALSRALPSAIEQAVRLLNPTGDVKALLQAVPKAVHALSQQLKLVAGQLGLNVDPPAPDATVNLFVLAEKLTAKLDDLCDALPAAAPLAKVCQECKKLTEAFVRLEPYFNEGTDVSDVKVKKAELLVGLDALYSATSLFVAPELAPLTKAQPPEGMLPVLKLPNPEFNVTRLHHKQPSGMLSRLARTTRSGLRQFLVNEIEPTQADAAYIWAVITTGDPVRYADLTKLPETLREGIDSFSLEEFSTESPVFYIPLTLIAGYAPPLKLRQPPAGRRFGPAVAIPEALAKAFIPAHGSPPRHPDGISHTPGTLNAVIEPEPFCHCSSCDLYLPAPRPEDNTSCKDMQCPYCKQPMSPAAPKGNEPYPTHPMGDFFCPDCKIRQPHQPRTRGLCPMCGTKLLRYTPKLEQQAKAAWDNSDEKKPWISFRGLTPQILQEMPQDDVIDLFIVATELLSSSYFDSHAAPAGLSKEDVENALVFLEAELDRRDIPRKTLLDDLKRPLPASQIPGSEKEATPDGQPPMRFESDAQVDVALAAGADLTKAGPSDSYAPIHPGSTGDLDPINLGRVLEHFHPEFLVRSPFIHLVGSAPNNGVTKNDIDVLIKGPLDPETAHVIKFRLGRMLPPEMANRLQFHGPNQDPNSTMAGPFTAHCALYDLVVRRRDDYAIVIEMRDSSIPVEHLEFSDPDDHKRLIAKQDPFLKLPSKERPVDCVLHHHIRGKSIHADLRIAADGYLIGYTLADQISGKVPQLKSLEEAKRFVATFDDKGSRWNKSYHVPSRLFTELKAPEPLPWLDIEAEAFAPGAVGATRFTQGYMIASARPRCSWGERTPYFHEYFLEKDKNLQGLLVLRLLVGQDQAQPSEVDAGRETPQGRPFWVATLTKSLLPSTVKPRATQAGRIPPQGWAYLPPGLKSVVPKRFQYWHAADENERKQIRDALIEEGFFNDENIRLVDGEFRRVVTKYYLYRPEEDPNSEHALEPQAPSTLDPLAGFLSKNSRNLDPQVLESLKGYLEEVGVSLDDAPEHVCEATDQFTSIYSPDMQKARSRQDQCMTCAKAPEVECIWADGRARAWFCLEHFEQFRGETEKEIVRYRHFTGGKAGKTYGEAPEDKTAEKREPTVQEQIDQAHAGFKKTVNVTPAELSLWAATSCAKLDAPTKASTAKVLKLLKTSKAKWNADLADYARDITSQIESALADPPGEPAKPGCPSLRDVRLMNLGHNAKAKIKAAKSSVASLAPPAPAVPPASAAADATPAPAAQQSSEKAAPAGTAPFTLSWQRWKGQMVIRAAPSRQVFHLMIKRADYIEDFQLLSDPTQNDAVTAILHVAAGKDREKLLTLEGPVDPGTKLGGLTLNESKNTPSQVAILARGALEFLEDSREFKKFSIDSKPAKFKGYYALIKEKGADDIWTFEKVKDPGQDNPKQTAKSQKDEDQEIAIYNSKPCPPTAFDDTKRDDAGQEKSDGDVQKKEDIKDVTLDDETVLKDVQIWDPAAIAPDDDKTNDRERLRPIALYRPMKVANREANAFRSGEVSRMLEQFATPQKLEVGLSVEPKYNGFRVAIQCSPDGTAVAFSEEVFERKTPLHNMLDSLARVKQAVQALVSKGKGLILDGEFMAYNADGGPVPRRELAQYRAKGPVDDAKVHLEIFDILYHPEKGNVVALPYKERKALLHKLLRAHRTPLVREAPFRIVHTQAQLKDALGWAKQIPGSEGAMLKSMEHTVSLRESDLMAKFKTVRQLTGIVWDRHPVAGSKGVYNFYYGFGPISEEEAKAWAEIVTVDGKQYVKAGRTFNAKLDAKVGDRVRIEVTEMLLDASDTSKQRLRGFTPVVIDKTTEPPTTIEQAIAQLEEGELKKTELAVIEGVAKRISRADWHVRVAKQDEDERYVLGVVLVPDETDSQGDIYDEATVRKASEYFMEYARTLGLMHAHALGGDKVRILENYIAPCDFELGDQLVRKGTWLLAARVLDDRLWEAVKSGELTGWSIEGSAIVQMLD